MAIWNWVLLDGSMYVIVLLGMSEALSMIPVIKANSVFQFIWNGLKWIKDKMPGAKKQ